MTDSPLQLAFAGTPELAAVILEALLAREDYRIARVYTQPDRPSGRGLRMARSPVARIADEHAIPVRQPAAPGQIDEDDFLSTVDALVVAAYGMLLPANLLQRPRWGCLNVHTSLLPRWRGAAPIQRAIEAGDTLTGISIMQIEPGLDTGPILLQESCPILPDDTGGSLHDKLATLGGECLIRALQALSRGKLAARDQRDADACYARKVTKQEARIDWDQPAELIQRKIRAFNPHPVAYTLIQQQPLRIWEAAVVSASGSPLAPGHFRVTGQGLIVGTGHGNLLINLLQAPGRKPVSSSAYVNGHPEIAGAVADPFNA